MKLVLWSSPQWLTRLLCRYIPAYARYWADIDQRSKVMGVAREDRLLFRIGSYEFRYSRESREKERASE